MSFTGTARAWAWWALGASVSVSAAACGSSATDAGFAPTGEAAIDAGVDADTGTVDARPEASRDAAGEAADDAVADAPVEAPGDGNDPSGPPYPIVLAHGFFGFDDFAGAGFLTYFYKVKDHLAASGETAVYTPTVDPFNSSVVRGGELDARVRDILAMTGKSKVVIIGHSQGGLDARVVAHDDPSRVAAVITVATPHAGSPVSDAVLGLAPGPISQAVLNGLGKLIGGTINPSATGTDSIVTALRQFSTKDIGTFNAAYPDTPGIPYFSVAGRSFLAPRGGVCDVPNPLPFLSKDDSLLDTCNLLLSPLAISMVGVENDGLVPVSSAKWGTFLGCVPGDHLDQIGQILGAPPGTVGGTFDYLDFWTELTRWVRAQGY